MHVLKIQRENRKNEILSDDTNVFKLGELKNFNSKPNLLKLEILLDNDRILNII